MKLVTVRGELTLESLEGYFTLNLGNIEELSSIPALPDEKTYYTAIESDLAHVYTHLSEPATRQFLSQNDECISTIHIMLGRGNDNTMCVYFRSSDTARIASDIGFLCRMAKKYLVSNIRVMIGSLHTKL